MKKPKTLSDHSPITKVFIVGSGRSGTSWLNRMIKDHPEAVGTEYESHLAVMFKPMLQPSADKKNHLFYIKNLAALKLSGTKTPKRFIKWAPAILRYASGKNNSDLSVQNFRSGRCFDYPEIKEWIRYEDLCRLIDKCESGKSLDLNSSVMKVWEHILNLYFERNKCPDSKLLTEKTPMNIYFLDWIFSYFKDVRAIEIIRDGRDVCTSMKKFFSNHSMRPNNGHFEYTTEYQAAAWVGSILQGQKIKSDPVFSRKMLSIRFEDLKSYPLETMNKVYEFLNLKSENGLTESILERNSLMRSDVKGEGEFIWKGEIGSWKRELSEADLKIFSRIAGETNRRLGYQ